MQSVDDRGNRLPQTHGDLQKYLCQDGPREAIYKVVKLCTVHGLDRDTALKVLPEKGLNIVLNGRPAIIHGLIRRPELNGDFGSVRGEQGRNGRYFYYSFLADESIAVKEENLHFISVERWRELSKARMRELIIQLCRNRAPELLGSVIHAFVGWETSALWTWWTCSWWTWSLKKAWRDIEDLVDMLIDKHFVFTECDQEALEKSKIMIRDTQRRYGYYDSATDELSSSLQTIHDRHRALLRDLFCSAWAQLGEKHGELLRKMRSFPLSIFFEGVSDVAETQHGKFVVVLSTQFRDKKLRKLAKKIQLYINSKPGFRCYNPNDFSFRDCRDAQCMGKCTKADGCCVRLNSGKLPNRQWCWRRAFRHELQECLLMLQVLDDTAGLQLGLHRTENQATEGALAKDLGCKTYVYSVNDDALQSGRTSPLVQTEQDDAENLTVCWRVLRFVLKICMPWRRQRGSDQSCECILGLDTTQLNKMVSLSFLGTDVVNSKLWQLHPSLTVSMSDESLTGIIAELNKIACNDEDASTQMWNHPYMVAYIVNGMSFPSRRVRFFVISLLKNLVAGSGDKEETRSKVDTLLAYPCFFELFFMVFARDAANRTQASLALVNMSISDDLLDRIVETGVLERSGYLDGACLRTISTMGDPNQADENVNAGFLLSCFICNSLRISKMLSIGLPQTPMIIWRAYSILVKARGKPKSKEIIPMDLGSSSNALLQALTYLFERDNKHWHSELDRLFPIGSNEGDTVRQAVKDFKRGGHK